MGKYKSFIAQLVRFWLHRADSVTGEGVRTRTKTLVHFALIQQAIMESEERMKVSNPPYKVT